MGSHTLVKSLSPRTRTLPRLTLPGGGDERRRERGEEEKTGTRRGVSVLSQTRSPMGILSQYEKFSKTLYLLILNFKRTLRKYIHSLLRIPIRSSDTTSTTNLFYTLDDGGTPCR
jgi:hypothetical protein